ncbi:universal stress protein [Nocardia gipuzkoensis]|uniref:universal stress protein n=1 Tax=Nocardia gipuzkoensis TaxID=2749991 RepID=UPI001E35B647|nr:universal stress protein [Nocardia gipuzkoensis]UGT67834.1 universal stress protein [Nocardia gipuzkoensis]
MDMPYRENPHLLASAPVVVGADGSEGSERAVRWAAETAARRGRTLLIAHGLDIAGLRSMTGSHLAMPPSIIEAVRTRGTGIAASAHRLAREVAPSLQITTEVSEASPSRLLIHLSKSAHLVALGATGNAGVFAHLGSTLLTVTSHGRGSIVVVRDTGAEPDVSKHGPVVVGVDGSPVSEAAIAAAFTEASERGAELVAAHSWSDLHFEEFAGEADTGFMGSALETAEDAILAERLAGWQEKYPDVRVTRKVYLTGATQRLEYWSKTAQLIVVGSRGRGGFTGLLLGSTSNFLVQHAHCPVLVAHAA